MKRFAPLCVLLCLSGAVSAEEDGLSLMERGAQMFLEGILKEVEPAIDGLERLGPQLRSFAEEMGPALGAFLDKVDDWSMYHPPEILPNGDIILRRKSEEENPATDEDPIDKPVDI